jgi:hypothetical protein
MDAALLLRTLLRRAEVNVWRVGPRWSFVLDLPALIGAAWFVASIC